MSHFLLLAAISCYCWRLVLSQCPGSVTSECSTTHTIVDSDIGQAVYVEGGNAVCFQCGNQPQSGTTWTIDFGNNVEGTSILASSGVLIVYDPACVFAVNSGKIVQCTLPTGSITYGEQVELQVFEPPGVPTSVVVTENSMLDISCSTENSSRGLLTMVQWLDGNGNVVSGTAELSITPVSRFNAGLYSCVATSNMGSMQSNTTVIVQYPPSISTSFSSPHKVLVGGTLSLSCGYDAIPPPTIVWSQAGDTQVPARANISSNDSRSVLTLANLGESEGGNYTCTATNLLGNDSTTITVVAQALPDAPFGLHVTSSSADSISIAWSLGSDGDGDITGVTLQYHSLTSLIPDGGNYTLPGKPTSSTIPNLVPNTAYEIVIYAESDIGRSSLATLNASTFIQAPIITNFTALSFSELVLEWIYGTALSPNATSRIVGWIVQYRPSNIENDTIVNITDPSTQLHVISSLDAGTEYCVRIAGDTLMGVGPFTEYQKMSTIFFLPSAPQSVHVVVVSSSGALLSWTAPLHEGEGAIIGYSVRVQDSSGRNALVLTTGANVLNATLLTGLVGSAEYIVDVSAISEYGSGVAAKANVTTPSEDSPQPLLTTPTVEEDPTGAVTLSWTFPGGTVENYILQYKTQDIDWSNELTNEMVLGGSALTVTLSGLTPILKYDVRIKTRNGNGESEYGPEASFSAPAVPRLVITGPSLPVQEGTTVFLNCTHLDGSIPAHVEWSRTTVALPSDAVVLESTLVVPDARPIYTGDYVCQVGEGRATFSVIVEVLLTPVPPSSDGFLGQEMTLVLVGVLVPAVVVIVLVVAICGVALCWVGKRGRRVSDGIELVMMNPDHSPPSPSSTRALTSTPLPTHLKRFKATRGIQDSFDQESGEHIYSEPDKLNPRSSALGQANAVYAEIGDEKTSERLMSLKIAAGSSMAESVGKTMFPNPMYGSRN